MKDKWRNRQFVWPKDSPGGKAGPDGWFGRMADIMKGKGPDIFVARKGETIRSDRWGNWDSYHDHRKHCTEQMQQKARGLHRYDPYSRKYVNWSIPHDWFNIGAFGKDVGTNGDGYPRFTMDEERRMRRTWARGNRVVPQEMPDWTHFGPKRFRQQYDHFWSQAHRLGENWADGLPDSEGPNPYMRMHQEFDDSKNDWTWNQYGLYDAFTR